MAASPPVHDSPSRSFTRVGAVLLFVSPWTLATWAILSWTGLGWVPALLLGSAVAFVFFAVFGIAFLYLAMIPHADIAKRRAGRYANVVSLQYKSPTDAEEAIKKIGSSIVPEIRKLAGFRCFYLVRTSETTSVHIGVFEDATFAEAGRKSVYPQLRAVVDAHTSSPTHVGHGDVRIVA